MLALLLSGAYAANNIALFKCKEKKISRTATANGKKDVEIMMSLKHLSNSWKTLEMHLINCEINIILTCS